MIHSPVSIELMNPVTVATIVIAIATVANVVVAVFMWRAMSKSYKASHRPYVGCSRHRAINEAKKNQFTFEVEITNFGAVPASNFDATWERISVGDEQFQITRKHQQEGQILFPGVKKYKRETVREPTYTPLINGSRILEFVLRITYEGTDGEKYFSLQEVRYDSKENSFLTVRGMGT